MPRHPAEWGGAAALWVTAAGWADAAQRRFGDAWILYPGGIATPEQALDFTRPSGGGGSSPKAAWLPEVAKTALKDARRWGRARRFTRNTPTDCPSTNLQFVWQHHDLFHDAGGKIARAEGCPLVSYVHAPQVWEARRWGIRRPGYGRTMERFAEMPQLRRSDVICCVSEEVAVELRTLGVDPGRILVSPMAVDASRFNPAVSGDDIRRRFGLGDAFVVGWIGSFRGFHGLDSVVESFKELHDVDPDVRLLLVGSGSEQASVEDLARQLGLTDAVVFAGAMGNLEIPSAIAAMDVALVSARAGDAFHYSPLKLREYLASGCAVIAPRLGEIPRTVIDGEEVLLYEPGNTGELAGHLQRLHDDAELRSILADAGRDVAMKTSTWDVRLDDLLRFPAFAAAARSTAE